MLKYRCRIVFITRCRYENQISLEVGELNPDTLPELVDRFFPEAERKQDEIKAIIDGHTFAAELAARLLANGLLKPEALLIKRQKGKAALDTEDKIGTTKDGRNRKAAYDAISIACFLCISSLAQNRRFFAAWPSFLPMAFPPDGLRHGSAEHKYYPRFDGRMEEMFRDMRRQARVLKKKEAMELLESGNFGIGCEFKNNSDIDLLVHDCAR